MGGYYRSICSSLGTLEACTGAGVSYCSDAIGVVIRAMVQSLWGGAVGALWVGEAINAMGYRPVVGAAKQVISELECASFISIVVL